MPDELQPQTGSATALLDMLKGFSQGVAQRVKENPELLTTPLGGLVGGLAGSYLSDGKSGGTISGALAGAGAGYAGGRVLAHHEPGDREALPKSRPGILDRAWHATAGQVAEHPLMTGAAAVTTVPIAMTAYKYSPKLGIRRFFTDNPQVRKWIKTPKGKMALAALAMAPLTYMWLKD